MTVTLRSACYYVTCVHVNTYDEFLFYSGCQCYFLYVYIWLYKINIHILWGVWVIQLLGLAILLFDDGMHCASDQHPKLSMYFHCYGYYLPALRERCSPSSQITAKMCSPPPFVLVFYFGFYQFHLKCGCNWPLFDLKVLYQARIQARGHPP